MCKLEKRRLMRDRKKFFQKSKGCRKRNRLTLSGLNIYNYISISIYMIYIYTTYTYICTYIQIYINVCVDIYITKGIRKKDVEVSKRNI